MRIAVVNSHVPFVRGGAESHAAKLVDMLKLHGHEAELVTVPFNWYPRETFTQSILAAKLIDIRESDDARIDMMIGLRFPAYLIPHPNPVFWVLHQHRAAFDLWDAPDASYISRDPEGAVLRQLISDEDRAAFARSARPIFANSRNVAGRLEKYIGQDAVPLYHPPPTADRLAPGKFGDYIFAPGRLNRLKRPELMLQALAHAPGARLAIAGEAVETRYRDRLVDLAHGLGVSDRVTWLGRVSDADLLAYYAGARAVLFPPVDEDYGYITLEAMLAGKPVITTTDAGGPLEFIRDEQEGLICKPDAASLGRAMMRLSGDLPLAERLGAAGRARYDSMEISWEHAVSTLTGENASPAPAPRDIALPAAREADVLPCSPMQPDGCILRSARDLADAWDFAPDSSLSEMAVSRFEEEWSLAQHLVACAQKLLPRRILDAHLNGVPFFPALLASALGKLDTITALSTQASSFNGHIASRDPWVQDMPLTILPAADRHSLRDGDYDLVIGRDLNKLSDERGLRDFLIDANQALTAAGHVVMCLPNCARMSQVARVLGGANDDNGAAGLSIADVARLATEAGFEKLVLETVSPKGLAPDPKLLEILRAGGDDLSLRGDVIVFVGQKIEPAVPDRGLDQDAPSFGSLSLAEGSTDDGVLRVEAHNHTDHPWISTGPHAVRFVLDWEAEAQPVRYGDLRRALPSVVGAGERLGFVLPVAAGRGAGMLHVRLRQEGPAGPRFSNRISVPCDHDSVRALLAYHGQGWEQY